MLCASARSACLAPANAAKFARAAQRRGRAGEDDRAAARAATMRLRDLAAVQEAAEAGHLPDLEVLARGLVEDAGRHVGADVEDQHLDRADARARSCRPARRPPLPCARPAEGARLAAGGLDRVDERRELVGAAARHAGDVAFAREAPGDRAAGRIAGADHEHSALRVDVRGALRLSGASAGSCLCPAGWCRRQRQVSWGSPGRHEWMLRRPGTPRHGTACPAS